MILAVAGWGPLESSLRWPSLGRAFALLFKSPTGGDVGAAAVPGDRWVLPQGLGPDELAAALVAQFWDRLRFFAIRRLRDAALAEDVAQETLRRTLESLRAGRVEKPESLPSFLFETARHVCMHSTRSAGRQARAFERVAAEGEEDASAGSDPLAGLISEERRREVRECLGRLEAGDREVLVLSYEQTLGAEEIGRRLGLTAGAVRVRRHRALARLAELMGVTRTRDRGHD
jgi:RNA polymerase sigma-70 factor (ECF subfamily)